jgi:F-type H+-transporting ATPase subunit delta
MKDLAAALRYARAVEASSDGVDELGTMAAQLAAVAQVMKADPVVADTLASPGISEDRRRALIDTLAKMAGLSPKTVTLLGILAQHRRVGLMPLIAQQVGRIHDRRSGIIEAEVTSAHPLTPDVAEKTRQTLERAAGTRVRLSLRTDPSLIGGIVAKVGSTVYDGSIRTRLSALRSHIAGS